MSVIDEIAAERRRQIEVEGWTPDHDAQHRDGQLSAAAACYAKRASHFVVLGSDHATRFPEDRFGPPGAWPKSWHRRWWKPKTVRRDLIRAAALIVAEIERLDRSASSKCEEKDDDDVVRTVAEAIRAGIESEENYETTANRVVETLADRGYAVTRAN